MAGGHPGSYCDDNLALSDLDHYKNDVWEVVIERARFLDFVILAISPTIIFLIHLLPSSVKQGLVLDYTDPTIIAAYTSHFVHLSTSHLAVNLFGYILVASLTYFLALASGQRKQFLIVHLIFILALPFALSGMNLLWQWQGMGLGFSGIVMAFVGYLPLVLLEFVGIRFDLPVNQRQAIWMFPISVAVAGYIALPFMYSLPLIFVALLSSISLLWEITSKLSSEKLHSLKYRLDIPGNIEFTILGGAVVFIYPFVSFSPDLIVEDGVLNVYTHGLGLCIGFAISYIGFWSGWLNID